MSSYSDVVRGAFVVSLSDHYQPFNNYVSSLTPEAHGSIPNDWFDEFWQIHFECRLPGSRYMLQQYDRVCRNQRIGKPTLLTTDC